MFSQRIQGELSQKESDHIKGIPTDALLTVYVTDAEKCMEKANATVHADGTLTVDLPPMAYVTICLE